MKLECYPGRAAARHGFLCSKAVTVAVVLPLLGAVSVASAETRGYLISWFAVATNNPDFAVNCPEAAKDPERVKFVAVGDEVPQRKIVSIVNG